MADDAVIVVFMRHLSLKRTVNLQCSSSLTCFARHFSGFLALSTTIGDGLLLFRFRLTTRGCVAGSLLSMNREMDVAQRKRMRIRGKLSRSTDRITRHAKLSVDPAGDGGSAVSCHKRRRR